jgi:hypothetical protein
MSVSFLLYGEACCASRRPVEAAKRATEGVDAANRAPLLVPHMAGAMCLRTERSMIPCFKACSVEAHVPPMRASA